MRLFLRAVVIWSAWSALRLLGADTVVMPDGERLPLVKLSLQTACEATGARPQKRGGK